MVVPTHIVLLATVTILGLRAVAGRLETTNDSPALWTGLAVMTTAWLFDVNGVTLFYGTLFAVVGGAVIRWWRSDKSLSVDVSFEDE